MWWGWRYRSVLCPESCKNALIQAQTDLGCCFITYFQVEIPEASAIFPLCGLESGDTCVGAFTDEPIVPGGDDVCQSLQATLPSQCRSDVSLDTLFALALENHVLLTDFCNSECGREVYDYHLQCDKIRGSNDAARVDFLCAQNDGGANCTEMFSDSSVQAAFLTPDAVCDDASDAFCSDECSSILQQASRTWGCCLFTFGAVSDSIADAEGVVEKCKIPGNPRLCVGAFSGEPIAADPGDKDDNNGVTATVVSSSVLVIAILALNLFD